MRKSLVLITFFGLISFALGGVAVASHDFTDVPDSHPFHDDISWLASTGVTEGFADGTYKPTQAVTRQAMAAFMRRLAGADPAVAPVVDAAELAGRTPADYDDAVTLNGRTATDFDDAVTLEGLTADEVTTNVGRIASFDPVAVTGTSAGTSTQLYNHTASVPLYAMVTLLVDTTFDGALFTCQADGVAVAGLTDLKIGDALAGYADRASVSGTYIHNPPTTSFRCFYESPIGTGAVEVDERSLVTLEIP